MCLEKIKAILLAGRQLEKIADRYCCHMAPLHTFKRGREKKTTKKKKKIKIKKGSIKKMCRHANQHSWHVSVCTLQTSQNLSTFAATHSLQLQRFQADYSLFLCACLCCTVFARLASRQLQSEIKSPALHYIYGGG